MKYNTLCENCLFSNTTSSNKPCELDIIDCIKSNKKISKTNNDFYQIENYTCKYAVNKSFLHQYAELTNQTNDVSDSELLKQIKNYSVSRSHIPYYLIINVSNDCDYTELYNSLLSLPIKPKLISIITYSLSKNKLETLVKAFESNILPYRLHNFINEIEKNEAVFTIMDTSYNLRGAKYILLLDINSLGDFIKNESILNINYIINVLQPESNILKKKDKNNFDTVLMTVDNYKGITKNISQSVEHGLNSIDNLSVYYYD